jgi:3-phenylpropionate/trans-cinnamate dioxygenase ferredoxin subunit
MSEETFALIPLAELAMGAMRACSIGARDIVVCRTKDGIFALDDICTHAFARLHEGRLRGTRLICPLHGAAFDIRDGRALGAPASQPLVTHRVRLVDEGVEISVTPRQIGTPP